MSIQAMKQALEALENNKLTHHYCEDSWYSCPKHEDGCANDSEGDECNCGADKANAEIDAAITFLRQAIEQAEKNQFSPDWDAMAVMVEEQQRMARRIEELEQAEKQEPVAWMFQHEETGRTMCVDAQQVEWGFEKGNPRLKKIAPLYTTPQPQKHPDEFKCPYCYDDPQPQREWVGLTGFEQKELMAMPAREAVFATEDKLKEKNT